MISLMLCKHKKTKKKLIAWAIDSRYGHEQGFRMGYCCCLCGKEVQKPEKPKLKNNLVEDLT